MQAIEVTFDIFKDHFSLESCKLISIQKNQDLLTFEREDVIQNNLECTFPAYFKWQCSHKIGCIITDYLKTPST